MRMVIVSVVLAWSSVGSAQTTAPAQAPPPKPFDCSAPEHRQFDFWIGEWDVVPNPATAVPGPPPAPSGRKAASNIITKAHDGCVLIENWTVSGQTGQSFNIYDRASRRWHQTWVDNGGGLHQYWGGLENGNMVFYGEVPLGPVSRVAGRRTVRLTFFPTGPDRVRQFSESLNMDGTWSPGYDLIYTRRKPAS
jgi:hypothetical protein